MRFVEDENDEFDENDTNSNNDLEELLGDKQGEEREISSAGESENEEPNTEPEGPTRRKHRRKTLTYQRKVHDIDSSLDESNYKLLDPVEELKTIKYVSKQQGPNKEKVVWEFQNKKPSVAGRQNASNVIRNRPGLSTYSRNVKTEMDAFSVLFTDKMFEDIVTHTNKRISNTLEKFEVLREESDKYPQLKEVTIDEMKAFIGLIYFRGLYGQNSNRTNIIFSPKHGSPVFGACMSRNRFEFLQARICFDDFESREERWTHDRFAAIRELFEQFNKNSSKALVPEDFISLDETLYPTRNQFAFKQYNPDKPAKYGILFKSLNSARYPYTYISHVYCGKPTGEANEYYVTGTYNYITSLVSRLEKEHSLSGRNLSMDRLYSSFPIADWLFERNITMVGTLQSNRIGIPPELKETKNRGNCSSEMYWKKDGSVNISSYVVDTAKKRRKMFCCYQPWNYCWE